MLLNIEKLIYGGEGLARLPAASPKNGSSTDGSSTDGPPTDKNRGRGKAVFVPFVLAGEKIEAAISEEKPGFARARATAILEPSPHRTEAPCPYFGPCGGCHYQHATYEHQLEIKQEILRENLRRIARIEFEGKIQVHPSPPWNYRNRSRLQLRTNPKFAVGYFKLASHELLPVEKCPISSPLINRGIAALWESGRAGQAVEGIHEVEFFANADDTKLLIELLCAPEARRANVRAWAEELSADMPEIVGVAAFREPQKGVQEPLVAVGAAELSYQTKGSSYRVSAGAFFQTNRFLTDKLVEIVTAGASGESALDLYAGVGLFSTALGCNIRHVISVESSQTAAADLQYNLAVDGKNNGKAVQATAEEYLTGKRANAKRISGGKDREGNTKKRRGEGPAVLPQKPDLIVVDPPRAGLGEAVARSVARLGAPRITYVSCDPATLARDLVSIQAAGYRVEQLHLMDLFPQTYHLETVVKLAK